MQDITDPLTLDQRANYEIQHHTTVLDAEHTGNQDANVANTGLKKSSSMTAVDEYTYSNKFAEVRDESDDDDNPNLKGKTPRTKKRVKRQEAQGHVKLMGPWATAFTLFKGFVCTGILYMPSAFKDGGWLFSLIAMLLALALTLYCIGLLLQTRKKLGGEVSFAEIGVAAYGRTGKLMVDVSLFASQVGFVCAYIYFIANQTMNVIDAIRAKHGEGPVKEAVKWWFAPLCFLILMPMVMVRKVQTFAKLHVFGDVMIALTLITLVAYASSDVSRLGW